MNVERSFRTSSLILVLSGFIGLTLAAQLPVELIALGFLALAISLTHALDWGLHSLATQLSRASAGVWNVLMVVAFLACVADLVWVSQDLLLAGINFLVILMVNKVFNLSSRRDYLYLYAISFLQLLSTAALTVEPWYALVFVTYLLSSIWTLLLYHLKNEAEEAGERQEARGAARIMPLNARFFWTTNGIAVAALVLTLAIFFVTPRAGTGFFQKSRGQTIQTSGFSQTVDLGVIGNIKLDPTVVMRVQFPNQDGQVQNRVYLKGAAFDQYSGRSWVNTLSRRRTLGQIGPGTFLVSRSPGGWVPRSAVEQEILIEALDIPVLFGMSTIQTIKGDFLMLQVDDIGALHLPYPPSRRFQYSVQSLPRPARPEDRKAASFTYPRGIQNHYLQLPPLSPRVAELAREVTKDASTPYQKAIALKWHLVKEYKYSLDVGNSVPVSPVEEFLFTRRTGYCEHYATAMVMMLRTLGIPARLTTGFLGGEWNDFGSYYTVRQQDAHAWVEVFFPRSGWVIFDPTPSVVSAPSTNPVALIGRLIDSFRIKWTRLVVQYSFRDQQAVLQEIRERGRSARSRASEYFSEAGKWMRNWRAWFTAQLGTWEYPRLSVLGGMAALTVLLVMLWRRGRGPTSVRGALPYTAQQLAATRLYGRMLRTLEARGINKAPGMAPMEFAGSLTAQWSAINPVITPLSELYCRARFGYSPLSQQELTQAESLLEKLTALMAVVDARQPIPEPTTPWGLRSLSKLRGLKAFKKR